MARSVVEIARRMIDTYMLGTRPDPNFAEIFAPAVLAWHNYDPQKVEYRGSDMARMMIERRAKIGRLIRDFRMEECELHIADSAFIYVHTAHGTLPRGAPMRIAACTVFEVKDGTIVTINSISDLKQREALEQGLAAM